MTKTERFNLRLEKDVVDKLVELSKKTGLSMSEIVRRLIRGTPLKEE